MSGKRSRPPAEARPRDPAALYEASHRVLRFLTGVMIVAFLLIVVLTTVSTGPFVQIAARGLYFLILAVPVASLLTWILRLWAERRAPR
ncbi:MAG: hypothetical protein OXG13_16005 [Gemmatimonadaceae bacterium]|nr:hypothetical protein [Gemmatimonadaceae bacterium]